jgi:predicted  nucleic acid-binding Zn ribbon protein
MIGTELNRGLAMYVAELRFPLHRHPDVDDELLEAIESLTGALRMNGQTLGREFPIARRGMELVTQAKIPEPSALAALRHNTHVRKWWSKTQALLGKEPVVSLLGEEVNSARGCSCEAANSYILYTNYLSLESPLRCGECFAPLPLYRVPPTFDEEYWDVMVWQSDYQACDTLWMNSAVAERSSYRQLSDLHSALTQAGLAVCRKIADSTGLPTYYYLHRYGERRRDPQRKLRCPGCGAAWALPAPWHRLFDYRCEGCGLLSCAPD